MGLGECVSSPAGLRQSPSSLRVSKHCKNRGWPLCEPKNNKENWFDGQHFSCDDCEETRKS